MKNLLFIVVAMISLDAFAQRLEIGRASKTFSIKQDTTSLESTFSVPLYRVEDRFVVEQVVCRVPQCSSESGDGSTGNWHNFYNVKQAEKSAALARAIKGIGPSIAEKIVQFNLLTSKPNSWSDFGRTIRLIETQLGARGLNYKFAGQVLEVYGYDNMISLGYGSERSCRTVESVCNQVTLQEFKTLSHYVRRNIVIDIKNQVLQSFETDTLTVNVGIEAADVRFSATGNNEYSATIYRNGTVLEVEGKRIKRALPLNEVTTALTKDTAGNFAWNLVIPSKYSVEDKDAQIEVTYELCRQGFFGNCSEIVAGPVKEVVQNNTSISKIFPTSQLVKGKRFYVRARLNKVNSLFYSTALSDSIATEAIRN